MNDMDLKLLEAAIRMGIQMAPSAPLPEAQVITSEPPQHEVKLIPVAAVSSPAEPVDPPLMKPDWEKELDDMLAKNGGKVEIRLQSGVLVRVVPEPKPAEGATEISHDTFKRLSRAAAVLNGKVVDLKSKAQADAETQALLDSGSGYWATPHIFVEVDKQSPIGGASASDFGIIAAPKQPPSAPPVIPNLWITLSAASIIEQVPMRVAGNKVIGTLIKTANGPLYAKTVKDLEHKLNIRASWAMSGGYTIEREAYEKYLAEPSTVIKFTRGEHVYLTTSLWIQRYAGMIRHWGTERVVMPIIGGYWLVVDKNGEIVR